MQYVCIEAFPLELQVSYRLFTILLSRCLTAWLLIPITLVRRCIEKHEGKYIEVPHAIDSGEEGAVHLNRVATPVPVTLIHLITHNTYITLKIIWMNQSTMYHDISWRNRFSWQLIYTWLMMKKMTVIAAHASVTNIRNLKRKMRPYMREKEPQVINGNWSN